MLRARLEQVDGDSYDGEYVDPFAHIPLPAATVSTEAAAAAAEAEEVRSQLRLALGRLHEASARRDATSLERSCDELLRMLTPPPPPPPAPDGSPPTASAPLILSVAEMAETVIAEHGMLLLTKELQVWNSFLSLSLSLCPTPVSIPCTPLLV